MPTDHPGTLVRPESAESAGDTKGAEARPLTLAEETARVADADPFAFILREVDEKSAQLDRVLSDPASSALARSIAWSLYRNALAAMNGYVARECETVTASKPRRAG